MRLGKIWVSISFDIKVFSGFTAKIEISPMLVHPNNGRIVTVSSKSRKSFLFVIDTRCVDLDEVFSSIYLVLDSEEEI